MGEGQLERAYRQLQHLYEVSTLLTRFEEVERTVPAVLASIVQALDVRSVIAVLTTAKGPRELLWQAEEAHPPSLYAVAHARDAYAYLAHTDPVPSTGPQPSLTIEEDRFVVLPLVVLGRKIFGVLQVEGGPQLDEPDLIFINAVANQLAVALDRREAWERDIRAREQAEAREATADWRRANAETLTERYEGLVDNLDHAFVWEADPITLKVDYVSARVEKLFGFPRRQWVEGPSFLEHVHPEDRDSLRATANRLLSEGTDQRCNHRCIDLEGRVVWLHTGMHLSASDSSMPTLQAVSLDVTSAKEAEEQVREQLNFTRAMARNLGEGVVAVDLGSRVTFTNRMAESLLGFEARMVLGMPFGDLGTMLAADGSPVKSPLERVLRSGRSLRSDVHRLARHDGRSFPVSYSTTPLRRAGKITGAILAFQDITDRKAAEDALHEAVRTREDILAIVSHDLRNPLSAILNSALLLRKVAAQDPSKNQSGRIEVIERSARRMRRLINDLSDFASLQAGRLKIQSQLEEPRVILEDALASFEPLTRERQQRLVGEIEGTPTTIHCDRERILQVFSNLIGNASSVTPEGGTIVLRVQHRGGEVCFSVSDPGPGIPTEDLARIFVRHERGRDARHRGSGLGLTIASGIVGAHGGRLWAESTVGVGSTFYFALPVGDVPFSPPAPMNSAPGAPHSPVLVVDDEIDTRETLADILEAEGFLVVSAKDGSEALQRLQAGPRPCLIVLDLAMPVMDGLAFAAELQKDVALASIPIIVLSGRDDVEEVAESMHAVSFLRKPLEPTALLDTAYRWGEDALGVREGPVPTPP